MTVGGTFIRFGGIGFRILEFLCAGIVLGVFSYFLSVLADNDLPIAARWKAVEGISGAGVIYTICGVVLTLCLGGVAFFGFLAVVLDVLFIGGFAAIAWFTRHGANSCTGMVSTPLGDGQANGQAVGYGSNGFGFGNGENATYFPKLHLACRLNTAAFAVSVIACFLFAITAVWNVLMVRHHKKEKRYGPSPSNNYTKGSGRRPFWKRNRAKHTTKDAEAATALGGTRLSGETNTTLGGNAHPHTEPKFGEPGYGQTGNYYSRQNAGHF